MGVEVRRAQTLSEAEQKQLFGWGRDIFEIEFLGLQWRRKDWHLLLEVDGQLVAHVAVIDHPIVLDVDGQRLRVAGMGGVLTVPGFRSRGHARHLLGAALAEVRSNSDLSFAMLFCRPSLVCFYRQLRWSLIPSPVWIEQPDGKIESPLMVMAFEIGQDAWPEGAVVIHSFPW